MEVTLLYNELLDEIRADEAALQEKKDLVRLLKKRLEKERAGTAFGVPTAVTHPPTLVQMVDQALPDLGYSEFVVGDVANAIAARGIALPDKPNGKISTVLARLQATGVILRTFTGGGNVPHRYMRVTVGSGAAAKEAPVSAT